MAGPTPVSALIHAATMVVAGVYLGARLYPVFYEGLNIGGGGINAMAAIGGTTVIIGAALAFVQDDIKKVLAYSTISQLGYMVMGLGVGAWTAAIFHLFTHAFFKANLFLGAGSVSPLRLAPLVRHEEVDGRPEEAHAPDLLDVRDRHARADRDLPVLAGFWSKDEILATAGESGYQFFMVRRSRRCGHDGRVHGPLHLPDLLRRVPGRARRQPTTTTRTPTTLTRAERGSRRPSRVAAA